MASRLPPTMACRNCDAIILAAAVEARCDLLLSEDLQDGFAWRGVVVTNPFRAAPDGRIVELLAS
jgi:predicted nucleic acid-binding protein